MLKIKSIGLCALLALALSVIGAQTALARGERQARVRSGVVQHKKSNGTVLLLTAGGQLVPDGALVHVVATGYSFKTKVTVEGTGKKAAKEQAVECETEYFEQGTIHRNLATNSWQVTDETGIDFCEGEEWFAGHGMAHPLRLTAPNIVTDESTVELFRTEEQIKAEEKEEFIKEEPIVARKPHHCFYTNVGGGKGHFKSKKEVQPLVAKLKGKMLVAPGSDPGCGTKAKWKGSFTLTYKGLPIVAIMGVAPTVTSVSPKEGIETGGTSVTITGSGFTGATAVQFGTEKAASYKVNSPTEIVAVSPKGSGTVDITVTTPVTKTATTPADQFTYAQKPTVSKISPKSGPEAGGTVVTITGTNFTSESTVFFGSIPATNVKVNSPTEIVATSPAEAAGTTVNVDVKNVGGTGFSTTEKFTYLAVPTVSEVSPNKGPAAGKTLVKIKGAGFHEGAVVNFGPNEAKIVKVSETEIEAESPAGAVGSVNVTVTTAGGTSTQVVEFKYE
jgi:hypothetical protein